MSMTIPRLPEPPDDLPLDIRRYLADYTRAIQAQFVAMANPSEIGAMTILLPISKFPTQADLANLRSGQVYIDTAAGNVLKVKP